MKFTASGRVNNSQSAVNVITAFFGNFNKDSFIEVEGGNIKMEIVFEGDELPIEIAESLNSVEELKFTYGHPTLEKSISDIKEEGDVKEEVTETEDTEPKEDGELDKIEPNNIEKPTLESELNKLANDSETFEDFVDKVGKCIKVGKRKEFFEKAVQVLHENKVKTWTEVFALFESKHFLYSQWESSQLNTKISNKFGDLYKMSSLQFCKLVSSYKNIFNKENVSIERNPTENENEIKNDAKAEIVNAQNKKSSFIHFPKISSFEEYLEKMDRTKSDDEKVEYVLKFMGWNQERSFEDQNIAKIAKKSVEIAEKDITSVIIKTDISTPDTFTLIMQFTKFINDFVQRFNSKMKIHTSEFLEDLIEFI